MTYYFKSLVERNGEMVTETFDPENGQRYVCQAIGDILSSSEIIPNTVHCQLPKRLSVSALLPGYGKTYRPHGIIFETDQKPDEIYPCDLMYLSHGKTFSSSDYLAKMIDGYKDFCFRSVEEMQEKYPAWEMAIEEINVARKKKGLQGVEMNLKKAYNECVFFAPVKIRPVALVGDKGNEKLSKLTDDYRLALYGDAEEFLRCHELEWLP